MKKIIRRLVAALFIVTLVITPSIAGQDSTVFFKARESARQGQRDFAFMHYRTIIRNYPQSKYKIPALFALGEYYFLAADHKKSMDYFNQYIKQTKDENGKLFALLYLLQFAKKFGQEDRIEEIHYEMVALKRQSFLFKKFREYQYRSPLHRLHKALYEIDNIQFFVEGILYEKIDY